MERFLRRFLNSRLTEPEFLNRLYAELGCSTLLDLHNLYASWRNGGPDPVRLPGTIESGMRAGNSHGQR